MIVVNYVENVDRNGSKKDRIDDASFVRSLGIRRDVYAFVRIIFASFLFRLTTLMILSEAIFQFN